MQLWLTPETQPDTRVAPPAACPHAGCAGRRFRLLQRVAKPVRDATPRTVVARRYACRACGRTFRVYPAGIDRGNVAVSVKRFAAALRLAGLSLRDVSRALAVFGAPLGKSQVQAVVAPRLRGLKHRSIEPLLGRVALQVRTADATLVSADARHGCDRECDPLRSTVTIHGRALTLRRSVDQHGRVALVVDDVDRRTRLAVAQWAQATLAGFGVGVEVVFPAAPSRRRSAAAAMDDAVASSHDGEADTGMRMSAAVDAPLEGGPDHARRYHHGPPGDNWRRQPTHETWPSAMTLRPRRQHGRMWGDPRSRTSVAPSVARGGATLGTLAMD